MVPHINLNKLCKINFCKTSGCLFFFVNLVDYFDTLAAFSVQCKNNNLYLLQEHQQLVETSVNFITEILKIFN